MIRSQSTDRHVYLTLDHEADSDDFLDALAADQTVNIYEAKIRQVFAQYGRCIFFGWDDDAEIRAALDALPDAESVLIWMTPEEAAGFTLV